MTQFLLGRLAVAVPTVIMITVIAFCLTSVARGDPAAEALRQTGQEPTATEVARYRAQLGLDDPFVMRYGRWVSNVARGDLGVSYLSGRPVADVLSERLPATVGLGLITLAVSSILGVGLGVVFGLTPGSMGDQSGRTALILIASLPSFWLALILVYWFGERWRLVPVAGYGNWRTYVLPVIALAAGQITIIMRLTRSSFMTAWARDHVRTARAKGLRPAVIIRRHALPEALLPIVTVLGLRFGHILGGSIVIEGIFAWPGMGGVLVSAISGRDLPIIAAFVLIAGTFFVLVNLATDIAYVFLDPRIRLGAEGERS